jgi:serine/threonine-protein kinase
MDGRTDTYALACVLYEMLAGEPPFRGGTTEITLARHRTHSVPSLRSRRGSVSRPVEQVITRALAKSPSDRHEKVADFADALAAAHGAGGSSIDGGTMAPWASGRRRLPLQVAGVVIVVVALGVTFQMWSAGALAGDGWEASVAVMPFENRTGDPKLESLGQSLAEEVINRLTSVPEVRVIDPYTAASLMKDSLGTPRLLDTLNVEHVIHGYIELRGDELVVNVSESDLGGFLSPRTRHRLDPARLDDAQVALANTVALAFLRDVGLEDRFDPAGSFIGPGRDAYLAGNAALGQRTPVAMRDAVGWFREAIRLEPRSAAALSGLSSAYALSLYYKYDVGLSGYELAARSLAAADSAIAVDSEVANGFSARGYIQALLGIDIDQAEADFARAEELAPNAPNGPSWSARILARKGLIDQAFSEARRARDLDPLQAGRRTALASLGFQLGNYEVAIEESREAYRLEPRLSLATAFEGRALALTDRGAECLDLDFGVYQLVRALCLHQLGRTGEARDAVREAEQLVEAGRIGGEQHLPELTVQDLAAYYGFIGEAASAARWLTHAFELSPAGVDARLLGSALFDAVRDDPVFASAVENAQRDARARVSTARRQIRTVL